MIKITAQFRPRRKFAFQHFVQNTGKLAVAPGEKPMFRRSIQFLALGAFAAVAAAGAAAANPCCACVQVVCEQFYIVNHGPVYSGPGIVVSPSYFELDRWPAVYPYVGRTYWYQPYDGP